MAKRIHISFLLVIACLLVNVQLFSQDDLLSGAKLYIQKAEQYERENDVKKAIKYYEKANQKDPSNSQVKIKLARLNRRIGNDSAAVRYFKNVEKEDTLSNPNDHLEYAEALNTVGDYEKARKYYRQYNKEMHGDPHARDMIFAIENHDQYRRDTLKYIIENLGINSEQIEMSPYLYGDSLLFVSNHGRGADFGTGIFDVYYWDKNDTTNFKRKLYLHHDGSKFQNAQVAISKDKLLLVVHRVVKEKSTNGLQTYHNALYYAKRASINDDWGKYDRIELFDRTVTVGHPALSEDGKYLVFAANPKDATSGFDLFISEIKEGKFGAAKNLGETINTRKDEGYPVFGEGNVLYFSSTGHPGLGGKDIFKVELFSALGQKVANLGYPINTNYDDFGYLLSDDGEFGYLVSNRKGGKGQDDIYKFKLRKSKKITIEGFAKDISNAPLNMGGVVIYDNVTKERLGVSDSTGYFVMEVDDDKDYSLIAKALNKPKTFDIHFEGFVKNKKDTSQRVKLLVINPSTGEQLKGIQEEGYVHFNLEEGRDYLMKVELSDSTLKMSDIGFKGFVMDDQLPHVNLGEVLIFDTQTEERLFKSDVSGFFDIAMRENIKYFIHARRKLPEDFFELSFEGFIKNKKDSTHVVNLVIVDPETGKAVYRSDRDGYSKFVLENGKHYTFMSESGDTIDASQLHFEGFVKDVAMPVIIGDVKVIDEETGQPLFQSDEGGFFSFGMTPGKKYDLVVKKRNPRPNFKIHIEGFAQDHSDSTKRIKLFLLDPETGDSLELGDDGGYVQMELLEGVPYHLKAKALSELLKTDTSGFLKAKLLKFEGFARDKDTPISAGKVNVFDAESDSLMFASDEYGFFNVKLDPKNRYKFYIKKENGDSTDETVIFNGFVKDENDSMTVAKIQLYDPNTGELIMESNHEGYFELEIEEGKIYEVVQVPQPIKKQVLNNVRLIVFEENERLNQYLLEEIETKQLFELHLDKGRHYYTDGIIKRNFVDSISKKYITVSDVVQFLEKESISIVDSIIISSIYYESNSAELNKEDKQALDKVVKLVKDYPKLKLVISSFADPRGTNKANKILTDKRNASVLQYLKDRGVDTDKVEAISYGEFKILNDCVECLEKDLERNRRTDFHITAY